MDDISIHIDTSELERALLSLPQELSGPVIVDCLQAAGDVMLGALVDHTPERADEDTPESTALPPGVMKADMTTEVVFREGKIPAVKVGPTELTGRVVYWQNEGYDLVKGGYRKQVLNRKGQPTGRTRGPGKLIKHISGTHFMEAAFEESSETAVDTLVETLGQRLFGSSDNSLEGVGPERSSFDDLGELGED